MRHVARMLNRAVENAEVLRAARAAAVLRRWDEAVGPMLAAKSQPDRFDKGTVWVATQGSAWAQELRMMKTVILSRLEAMAGEKGMFLDVRFGVRPPRQTLAKLTEEADQLPAEPVVERPFPKIALRMEPPILPEKPAEEVAFPRTLSIRELAQKRLEEWPDKKP